MNSDTPPRGLLQHCNILLSICLFWPISFLVILKCVLIPLQIIDELLCLQAILFIILNGGLASVGLDEGFKNPTTLTTSPSHNDDYYLASHSPEIFTLSGIALGTTVLPLLILAWLVLCRARKIFTFQSLYWATFLSVTLPYFLLIIHWFTMDLASSVALEVSHAFKEFSRLVCPQLVYSVNLMVLLFTIGVMTLNSRGSVSYKGLLLEGIVSMLSGSSATIMLLLGRKGPTIILIAVLESKTSFFQCSVFKVWFHPLSLVSGLIMFTYLVVWAVWCLVALQDIKISNKKTMEADQVGEMNSISHFSAAVDWNLVAVQLFFCTGHRFVVNQTYFVPLLHLPRKQYISKMVNGQNSGMFFSLETLSLPVCSYP